MTFALYFFAGLGFIAFVGSGIVLTLAAAFSLRDRFRGVEPEPAPWDDPEFEVTEEELREWLAPERRSHFYRIDGGGTDAA